MHFHISENAIWTNQFDNLDNMDAHYRTTGPEIWEQTDQTVDGFVCSCGTGGTIAGTSKFLKEKATERNVHCYLASPQGSGVILERAADGTLKQRLKTAEEKFAPFLFESACDLYISKGLSLFFSFRKSSSVLEGIASSRVYQNLDQAQLDGEFIMSDEVRFWRAHSRSKLDF